MTENTRRPTVFMMDLWATVPYYTAYLSKALLKKHVNLMVGSISYYLDPGCFSNRGIMLDPGLMDVVGKFRLPRLPRRVLKLLESLLNLAALAVRFLISSPDVVHVQFLPMLTSRLPLDLWFVQFCRRRGSKIVLTVHDLLPHNTGESHKQIFHDLYQMVDRIICHSESIREGLAVEFSVKGEKVAVIPHGPFFYDLPATAEQTLQSFELDPRKMLVLWQGIISPYKGIDLLLEAWRNVEATVENVDLLIVGTGPTELLDQIREQIRSLKLRRVRLHPRFISTEELVALYRAADIVVYPYGAITTSGALATGLALGKTIVASDLPVFRELLTDRENVFFFDPQRPVELADALVQLLEDALLRERLAENVRKMNFGEESWLSIADKTIECYKFVQPLRLWYKN
ncbi:glycosyltransferase family 4 protein [Tunturiibacter gelidoferens]|uniref:Glycosyltransferase involved in cell wall biosynthesis n=1 Tax=Tunturiibacter lichenicola TaxID=2051959 RepID=A0A7Y9T8W6_9BACT|nr:glycosyltransferase involved in cell wall biosynthesis [Edaphobacter lichenicola]